MGGKGDEMKVFCRLLVISIFASVALAQTTANIEGRIDPKDLAVTSNVILEKDGIFFARTAADSDGNYVFKDVPEGLYTLRVDGLNAAFVGTKRDITVVAGKLFVANFTLVPLSSAPQCGSSPDCTQIRETVTVSADQRQPLEEVSKSVNVIDGQEMRERADFTLVESLRTIPGFRVQQLGGFGRTASIKSRGLRNQDTAILIDGVRFRDASSITGDASAFLSDFTLTSVSRIEVLRGPGSSLYGTNAIGGTVDFQTPAPQAGWHGQFSANAGGLGLSRFRGNVSNGLSNGKFGFNVGVSRTDYRDGIDKEDDANNTNFQSRIEAKPFENTSISARFFVSDAFVRLNSSPDTFGVLPVSNSTIINANPGVNFTFDANDPDSNQKSKFFNGQVVLTQVINDRLYFQGYYSGLKTKRRNTNGLLGVPFQSESTSIFDGSIHTANGHINWTPDDINRITVGYEFEHEKLGNEGFTPSGNADFFTNAYQSSNTIYAQDLVSLFDGRLQLAGGFRFQFFNLNTPDFSLENAPYTNLTLENPPNAYTFDGSASYYFAKTGTKLRTHVGNGYRVPSLYERFGTFYSTFGLDPEFVPIGAPNLKPEHSAAFDAGIEQNLFDNKARLSATYFYTRLIDTIGYGLLPDNDPFGRDNNASGGGYLNTKGAVSRGAEFSGEFRPTSTTEIFASYTYTNSDQLNPQVRGSGIFSTLGVPESQFTLVATQRFKRVWVNMDFLATSDYLAPIFSGGNFNTYIYRFDGNRKADLTAGYTFPINKDRFNLRVYGTIENLFDQEYFENGFRTAGVNGRAGLSFGF